MSNFSSGHEDAPAFMIEYRRSDDDNDVNAFPSRTRVKVD